MKYLSRLNIISAENFMPLRKKEYEKVLKKKEINHKAKAVLTQNKKSYTKSELVSILK